MSWSPPLKCCIYFDVGSVWDRWTCQIQAHRCSHFPVESWPFSTRLDEEYRLRLSNVHLTVYSFFLNLFIVLLRHYNDLQALLWNSEDHLKELSPFKCGSEEYFCIKRQQTQCFFPQISNRIQVRTWPWFCLTHITGSHWSILTSELDD